MFGLLRWSLLILDQGARNLEELTRRSVLAGLVCRRGMGEFRDAFLPKLNRARDTLAVRLFPE